MAKYYILSVGCVGEKCSKNYLLKYLKGEVAKVRFKRLIVFASEKVRKNVLSDFFDYLKINKFEFSVYPGEDKDNVGYIGEIANMASEFVDKDDAIILEVGYINGFFLIKQIISPTRSEQEEFEK